MTSTSGSEPISWSRAEPMAEPKRRVLEQGSRLSESVLWDLQRAFYERQGLAAWSGGTVPHYVTSNAFIARAYARIVHAFLDDCGWPEGGGHAHVVELGAGPGRFAYQFLKSFLPRCEAGDPFTYVLTDFTERAIEDWRRRPELAPYLEAGLIDFAVFDA